MPAPNWNAFTAVTLVVLVILIALARASQAMLAGEDDQSAVSEIDSKPDLDSSPESESQPDSEPYLESESHPVSEPRPDPEPRPDFESNPEDEQSHQEYEMTTKMLLLNVALSQGLFGVMLVVAAVLAGIPAIALGVESATLLQLGIGIALGVALFVANELGQRGADTLGIDYEDGLREMLTPDSLRGWVLLLGGALPIIAGFEELLFRSALIGVLASGYGLSPWLLAALSSIAFAVGHGAQGPAGILVTGALGGVLAAAFIATGSLLVVVVAHYLVNALEFVVHAGDEA
ncbi:Membrane protease YdiL, CAAX protease family [Haladaptatus litoreus]|uniref:Membrane protease YdiL, CAAX protease family n=1 Tax=Haladaptatus litoreus TaxID=553468 RepID=A0A1N6WJV6_9EURY|nr:CPBP family intramembrane glutamic endopeptidase [Haladaptatus litoreus]SIQ90276.1 Membrane protease YdiL, CAAX protease family [Haladaptatus litoreus]